MNMNMTANTKALAIGRLEASIKMYAAESKKMDERIQKAKSQGFVELVNHYEETKLICQTRVDSYREAIAEIEQISEGK